MSYSDVSVVMATRNEEMAVGNVIAEIRKVLGKDAEIVIVDSSTDKTRQIASSLGARIIPQEPRGYGVAMRAGLLSASRNLVTTLDCDCTYPVEDLPKMISLARKGYDVVSASRFRKGIRNMSLLNIAGNLMLALFASMLFMRCITDITTGMRVYHTRTLGKLGLRENLGLPAELILKHIKAGCSVVEVPIDYRERVGVTKLNPLKGGISFLHTIVKLRVS